MLYPKRNDPSAPHETRRLLAMGAALLFVVAAFLAFGGALQGALGVFFAAMALHTLQSGVRTDAPERTKTVLKPRSEGHRW